MAEEIPAMQAARNSWRCVQAHDREGWLDLMAEDVCVEDPIGVAPTNPTGKGVRGKKALGEFYDMSIGPSKMEIEVHESHAAENESAHLMTIRATLPNGVTTKIRSIFTYRVNDAGKITNLRGYWTVGGMEITQPD